MAARWIFRSKMVIVLSLVAISSRVCAARFATPQLLSNPGFEAGEGTRAAGWGLWPPAGSEKGVSSDRDGSVKHSGEFSGRLKVEVEDFKGICTWHHPIVPCLPGQEFVLSFWVKGENVVGPCGVDVQLRVDELHNTESRGTSCETSTYDWKHHLHRFTIPSGFKFLCVVPYLRGKGTVWFDEVELYGVPELRPLAVESPPVMDGDLSDSCWKDSNRVTDFSLTEGLTAPARQTEVWAAFDAKNLYFALRCERKPGDKLKSNVKKRDGDVWTDDDIEIFLNPRGDFGEYYQFVVNPAGVQYDSHGTDRGWSCTWAAKTKVNPTSWSVEIAIPISGLPIDLSVGPDWCANFGRSDTSTGQASSWSATFGGFHSPGRFGRLQGVGCDFVPAYTAESGAQLKALITKLEETSQELALESAPAALAGNAADLLGKLRTDLTSFKQMLTSPRDVPREQWSALPERFRKFQTDLSEFTGRSLRLRVFSFWSKRLGQAPRWGIALASPLHKVARDGEGFTGDISDALRLRAARGEFESAQVIVVPFGDRVSGCRVKASDLTGPQGRRLQASFISIHPVGYVKTEKPGYSTERVGWWPDPLLPPGPMDVAAEDVQPFWLSVFVPHEATAGTYRGPIEITDGRQTLTCQLELRVRDFSLPRKGHLATPFGCNPADISFWYTGSRDYQKNLKVDEWIRWCRFMLDYRLSPTVAGQAYLKQKYRDDATWDWDYTSLDRVMTELAPRIPDRSIALAGVGQSGWRAGQGSAFGYVEPGHGGKRAGRVKFPKKDSWADASRDFPGALAAERRMTHLSFWCKAEDQTSAGQRVDLYLNGSPLRYVTTFAVPGGDWQRVRIPLPQFGGNQGEGPLDLQRLSSLNNLQFVLGSTPHSVTFLVDDVVADCDGGRFTIDDFEPDSESREIVQTVGSLVRHWKEKGWLRLGHVYGWDEARPEDYDVVRQLYRKTLAAVPDARIMQTYYVNRTPDVFLGLVKTWCPITSVFDEGFCRERQKHGEDVWLYVCCGPTPPHANFMIDQPALAHRVLFWQAWQCRASGFLYWETNYWYGNYPGGPDAPRWPAIPWSMEKAGTYRDYRVNGDGWLIYPGPNQEPLPSVRLENIRDGIEDYEYLFLLRDLVEQRKRSGSAGQQLLRQAEDLLKVGADISKDFTHYTNDEKSLLSRREQLADMIEKLARR